MSITATVDGTAYTGINTITTGGKTIALTESGGGGSVGDLSEYNSVTASGASGFDFTIAHELTQAPKIIIGKVNKTFDTTYTGKAVFFVYVGYNNNGTYYSQYFQTNSNTGAVTSVLGTKVDTITSAAQFTMDSTNVVIRKPGSNYNWDPDETYTFEFYA